MSKKTLPELPQAARVHARSFLSPSVLARWDASLGLRAEAGADEDRTITIYDIIGEDWWTGSGFTAKRMAAALRSLGKGAVTVAINSPGGDFFEGLAMYSMLREHNGEVTVKVMGLAASAASTIAMAGDVIQISRAGFFMIHNTWVFADGNRNDLRDIADQLEPIDTAMAELYAARTGDSAENMGKLMDRESWIGGNAAVAQGFADSLLPSDEVTKDTNPQAHIAAVRRIEAALRASGMPKSEAMRLISEFKSSVGEPAGSGAGDPPGRTTPADPRDEGEENVLEMLRAFKINA